MIDDVPSFAFKNKKNMRGQTNSEHNMFDDFLLLFKKVNNKQSGVLTNKETPDVFYHFNFKLKRYPFRGYTWKKTNMCLRCFLTFES